MCVPYLLGLAPRSSFRKSNVNCSSHRLILAHLQALKDRQGRRMDLSSDFTETKFVLQKEKNESFELTRDK